MPDTFHVDLNGTSNWASKLMSVSFLLLTACLVLALVFGLVSLVRYLVKRKNGTYEYKKNPKLTAFTIGSMGFLFIFVIVSVVGLFKEYDSIDDRIITTFENTYSVTTDGINSAPLDAISVTIHKNGWSTNCTLTPVKSTSNHNADFFHLYPELTSVDYKVSCEVPMSQFQHK